MNPMNGEIKREKRKRTMEIKEKARYTASGTRARTKKGEREKVRK